jgi:hypothetical protein
MSQIQGIVNVMAEANASIDPLLAASVELTNGPAEAT